MASIRLPIVDTEIGSQFARDGYYLAKGVFTKAETDELESDFDRIVNQILASGEVVNARWSGPEMERVANSSMVVLHTHNVQQYSAAWAKALYDPRYLEFATGILGPDVVLHHSKLFQKPSETGAPFPMHQDWSYFPTEKDSMIAAVIHVSKATDEMGCLRVYPGSHLKGRMEESSGQNRMLEQFPLEGATPIEAEPGDVLYFHYFTVHGSMPNRSSDVRKTVLVQMHAGDDKVEEGNLHPNERLVLSGWNHHATRGRAGIGK
jgi:ectoine hydroxylase-related dioxygenase (phytanoyl-CoA dioxygenase family)